MRKYIPFYALSVIAVACLTLPVHQNKVTEITLPPAPEHIQIPFRGVEEAQIEEVLQAMTLEEKIGQCILWKPTEVQTIEQKKVIDQAMKGRIGGVLLNGMELDDFVQLTDSLRQVSPLPLFIGTDEKVSLHGQFSGFPQFPQAESMASISDKDLVAKMEKHYFDQCTALGINLSFLSSFSIFDHIHQRKLPRQLAARDELSNYHRLKKQLRCLSEKRMLAATTGFKELVWPNQDSLLANPLQKYHLHTRAGLPGLLVEDAIFANDSLFRFGNSSLQKYFDRILNFNGLSFALLGEGENPAEKILAGADQIIVPDSEAAFRSYSKLLRLGSLSEKSLDDRVRRILKAKSWVNGGHLPVEIEEELPLVQSVNLAHRKNSHLKRKQNEVLQISREKRKKINDYFRHPAWKYFSQNLFESSVILTNNENELLPFQNLLDHSFTLFEYDGKTFPVFEKNMAKYVDFEMIRQPKFLLGGLPVTVLDSTANNSIALVLLDGPKLHPITDRRFIEGLNQLSENKKVVLVNFGYPENLGHFEEDIVKFQIFERNKFTESYVAQALFGGVSVGGKLPLSVSDDLPISSSANVDKIRLSFGTPERNGIAPERLVGIDAIAKTAIDKKVFPGCQVAVAKNGNVLFSKAFGQHTYGEAREVRTDDLYDIASVTKVAATTLALMKLDNEKSIDVTEKLNVYVPESEGKTVGYIRLKDLLVHRSNLQAPMPIGKYFNYRNVPQAGCNDIFCRDASEGFDVQICSDLYFKGNLQQSIWKDVFALKKLSRWRAFRYSDVNFYLLQKVVEERAQADLATYVRDEFYRPLGFRHMTYRPLDKMKIDRIVPTEKDLSWRKSLVHGFVHDPSAALMGGVGGNAGLFSNAEDLAALFQMMLDDGKYGGEQFLQPGTVVKYSTPKYGNHRGLGFDKPINRKYPTYSLKTPATAYGHTGFTGTCVWADPENDLVYVFLSNRVHPSSNNKKIFYENVRGRIHEVVYRALNSQDEELPEIGGE